MQKLVSSFMFGVLAGSLCAIQASAEEQADVIKSAESAAPAAISKDATIYSFDTTGKMITVREGTTGWWCIPDNPGTPGPDPMCGDPNTMDWMMAVMGQTEPPKGKVGFGYMLAGGSDSNTDPFATGPTDDNNWVITGPHVMVFNAMDMMAGYPTEAKPDPTVPYVMYHGTPYAHIMFPVE